MARILGDLSVRLEEGGRMWALLEPLEYRVGSADSSLVIEVPAGLPDRPSQRAVVWAVAGVELEGKRQGCRGA